MTVSVRKNNRRCKGVRAGRISAPQSDRLTSGRRIYILLTLLTAAGIFVGAYSFFLYDTGGAQLLGMRRECGFSEAFASAMGLMLFYIGVFFFSGFSAAGRPVAYLLCIFKGMGAGYLSACIFSDGFFAADIAAAADILPFEAMSLAPVIFAARENIRLSGVIYDRTFKDAAGERVDIGLYFAKFAVILLAAAAAAAADGFAAMLIR